MSGQMTFAEEQDLSRQRNQTRRERFLAEMDAVVPWARLMALIKFLGIGVTGSHVLHKSLDRLHAASMPDAAQAVNRSRPFRLSHRNATTVVSTSFIRFRHVINGPLSFASSILT